MYEWLPTVTCFLLTEHLRTFSKKQNKETKSKYKISLVRDSFTNNLTWLDDQYPCTGGEVPQLDLFVYEEVCL